MHGRSPSLSSTAEKCLVNLVGLWPHLNSRGNKAKQQSGQKTEVASLGFIKYHGIHPCVWFYPTQIPASEFASCCQTLCVSIWCFWFNKLINSNMRVLITGAAGFIGQLVAKQLLNDDNGSYTVILTDVVEPPVPEGVKFPDNATSVKTDLLDGSDAVVDRHLNAVFVFHGIMSAGAEADFELGRYRRLALANPLPGFA